MERNMRQLWIVALVLLVGFSFAMAQEIHWADQKTVEWDAPEFLIDGTPVPPEDVIAYNMYIRKDGETTEPYTGTTPDLEYTFTLPEGVFEVGVSALRYIAGAGDPFESDITWSRDADPPFLLGYGRPPVAVGNFRIK